MYLYTLVARASGERLFVQAYLEVYNIMFTSLPIILFCVFDQDVTKEVAARSPEGYTPGILRLYYTHTGFVRWMLEAVFLAALVTYVPALALGYPGWSLSSPPNGDPGVNSVSMVAMSLVCVGVNLRLAIEMHSWSGLEHLFMWGSLLSIELCCILFSYAWYPDNLPTSFDWNDLHGIISYVWDDLSYWLVCVLVLLLSLAPRLLGKAWQTFFADDFERCMRSLSSSRLKSSTIVRNDVRFTSGDDVAIDVHGCPTSGISLVSSSPSSPTGHPPGHCSSPESSGYLESESGRSTAMSERSRRSRNTFSISEEANRHEWQRTSVNGVPPREASAVSSVLGATVGRWSGRKSGRSPDQQV